MDSVYSLNMYIFIVICKCCIKLKFSNLRLILFYYFEFTGTFTTYWKLIIRSHRIVWFVFKFVIFFSHENWYVFFLKKDKRRKLICFSFMHCILVLCINLPSRIWIRFSDFRVKQSTNLIRVFVLFLVLMVCVRFQIELRKCPEQENAINPITYINQNQNIQTYSSSRHWFFGPYNFSCLNKF